MALKHQEWQLFRRALYSISVQWFLTHLSLRFRSYKLHNASIMYGIRGVFTLLVTLSVAHFGGTFLSAVCLEALRLYSIQGIC